MSKSGPQTYEDFRRLFFEHRDEDEAIEAFKEWLVDRTELSRDFLIMKRDSIGVLEMWLDSLFFEFIKEVQEKEKTK